MLLKMNIPMYRHVALTSLFVLVGGLYGLVLAYGSKPNTPPTLGKQVLKETLVSKNASPKTAQKIFKTQSLVQKSLKKQKFMKVSAKNYDYLKKVFDNCAYDLQKVRTGNACVPRIVLTKLPKDMGKTHDMKDRKATFIKSMLPMILHTNEKIMEKRKVLFKLAAQNSLNSKERLWLEGLATEYNLKNVDIQELKRRVDIVPPSLFLAQASMETGWGTSNAARNKKSLFGVTLKSGVKSYDSLQESVDAYIHNLNYNYAYREMRDLRAKMRKRNAKLCSHKLIGKLLRYCERRGWYVDKIRKTIAKNNLKQFDSSKLISYDA